MATYFARHTKDLDVDDSTRRILWEQYLVAIHFPGDGEADTRSLDPEDYDGSGKRAMRLLVEMAAEGGYVCAQHYGWESVQLGYVSPGSRIKLLKGTWGTLNGREGREAVLKSLQLESVKVVKPYDYATILVGRPRQGTLNHWPSAGTLIENIVREKLINPVLANLSYPQQEILCSEFLRTSRASAKGLPTLDSLVLPVGRTMKDLDFVGIATDGKPIFAQVTFSDPAAAVLKSERLRKYDDGRGCHLLMFCSTEKLSRDDRIMVIPLSMVFAEFTSTKAGKKWLEYTLRQRESRDQTR